MTRAWAAQQLKPVARGTISVPWAARYDTCLFIKLTQKGVVFFLFLLLSLSWHLPVGFSRSLLFWNSCRLIKKHLVRLPDTTAGQSICIPLRSTGPALLYCASVPACCPQLAQAPLPPLLECGTGLHWVSGSEQTGGCGRCIARAVSLGGRQLSSHPQTGAHLDL